MREMNHRVKNNLAIISSLISLKIMDDEENVALLDLRSQIDAIRFVYERLYTEEQVSRIHFKTYCRELLEALFTSSAGQPVEVDLRIDEILIDSRMAVQLGLILNETATNAIKYGFSRKEEGVFSVEMEEAADGGYTLIIGNNGTPFPEDIDQENPSTLGLRFILAMTEQLGGTVSLKKTPRPEFRFRFPPGEEQAW